MTKKIISSVFIVMLFFTCINVNATKWKDANTYYVGGCEITTQVCGRKFLSFDGCTDGDTRSVYDPKDINCQRMEVNARLILEK